MARKRTDEKGREIKLTPQTKFYLPIGIENLTKGDVLNVDGTRRELITSGTETGNNEVRTVGNGIRYSSTLTLTDYILTNDPKPYLVVSGTETVRMRDPRYGKLVKMLERKRIR